MDRKLHLPIHVGYWPVRTGGANGQSRLRNKWEDARDRGLVSAPREDPDWRRWQASARQQTAARELSQVHWTSQVPPPENFEPILKSGQFSVTGNVYFSPLQPFQSNPTVPSSREEARKQFITFEYIGGRGEGFVYPEQAR